MPGISFIAAEFVVKLREGHFSSPPMSATGLVKLPDDEAVKGKGKAKVIEALQFVHGSDCDHWVSVPLRLIDRVDFLRVVRCKDHSHPLVTLIFSVPETDEAKTFAAIANLTSAASSNLPGSRSFSVLGAPVSFHPAQSHAFLTTLNMAGPVAPDANGICPPGYHPCSQGCCPDSCSSVA
jgi:hypothetical protein